MLILFDIDNRVYTICFSEEAYNDVTRWLDDESKKRVLLVKEIKDEI